MEGGPDPVAGSGRAVGDATAHTHHAEERGVASARLRELAAVFLGGTAGTALRALTAELMPYERGAWPWATFVVNVIGATLLGYVAGRAAVRPLQGVERQAFLSAGLCGGLTTFSTLQLEVAWMLDDGHGAMAAGYLGASVAAGIIGVLAAVRWARRSAVPR